MHPLALVLALTTPAAAVDEAPPEPLPRVISDDATEEEAPVTTTEITAKTTTRGRASAAAPAASAAAPAKAATASDAINKSSRFGKGATFFGGARTAMAFPPGGDGPAPMAGVELGVAAQEGVGFGLHVFGAMNTPGAPSFDLPKTPYGFGATADVRYYLQTIEPLRLYPTLSVGFMAGPAADTGKNSVLPLLSPGFGARVNLGPVYTAIEIGAADFYIPFMALAVGWEPDHES